MLGTISGALARSLIPYHIEWLYIQSWQKKSKKSTKKSKKEKKIKKLKIFGTISGALARSLICISSLTSQHVYIGAGTSHRSARSLNCDNFGQEQYFLMR